MLVRQWGLEILERRRMLISKYYPELFLHKHSEQVSYLRSFYIVTVIDQPIYKSAPEQLMVEKEQLSPKMPSERC